MRLLYLDIDKLKQAALKRNSCGDRARRKLRVLQRDGFKCTTCGSTEQLTIAHIKPIRRKRRGPCQYKVEDCKTQCVKCHIEEEFIKKEGLK